VNAVAHCVEGLGIPERTPHTMALAAEAIVRLVRWLPRVVADGSNRDGRAECLAGAWLAGTVLVNGTGLHHKLAHVLGGLGLPHAETHAIILPHVTRFNLPAAPEAADRLARAFATDDPAGALARLVQTLPIPHRLRDVGFDKGRIADVAALVAALRIEAPRPVGAEDAAVLLEAAS